MGLLSALQYDFLPSRHSKARVFIVSLFCFMLFTAITLYFIQLRNKQEHDALGQQIVQFTQQYLTSLTESMSKLNQLPVQECPAVSEVLIRNAAMTPGVRTLLLVRNGNIFCSSIAGAVDIKVNDLFTYINEHKPLDIKLQQGTRFIPKRPLIVVWLANPDIANSGILATIDLTNYSNILFSQGVSRFQGIALITENHALLSSSSTIVNVEQLPDGHYLSFDLNKFPLSLRLYGPLLSSENIRYTLLSGVLLSMLLGALFHYIHLNYHSIEREIIRGMRHNEFFVEYQPVIDSQNNKIIGVEALLRWQHPTEGRIPPDVFINYAESHGLIVSLTQYLLRIVAIDAHSLAYNMPKGLKLSINISPYHLTTQSFRDDVRHFISSLPQPNFLNIVFEITERGMIDNEQAMSDFMWLRQQGIEVAIDDFGTGYSALIYLEKFTVDYLKIDRGFVMSIDQNTLTTPVLDTVLRLTDQLKLKTVAEGVETASQAEYLRQHGVAFLQGFLYSRALGLDALIDFTYKFNRQIVSANV